jgi:small subunit ribosomal protein S6
MRYYESLYIVNPNYEQERLDEVIKSVADKSIEYGFSIINHRVWGKKRLAYSIEKHKYGSFILLHFETELTENLERFERFMILQKPILRNQTVGLTIKPEAQVEEKSVNNLEQKETTEESSVVTETKEQSNVESEETTEESSVVTETKEQSNVESEENSEEGLSVEEETVVVTEEESAQNEETEEKVELAIEEEATEEVQE